MRKTNIDWRMYLFEIIDGKYALDIQKIGDSASFLKNQIESFELVNSVHDNFLNCLIQLISETSFLNSPVINDVDKYQFLIDWGIKFIPDNQLFLKKMISLQFSFAEFDFSTVTPVTNEKIKNLLLRANFAIVEFIEKWNIENSIFTSELITEKNQHLEVLKSLWEVNLLNNTLLEDINVVKGLIYLNTWEKLDNKKRKEFFLKNKNNVQLFAAVLFDLKRLEKNKRINYYPFIDDIIKYKTDFLSILENTCSSWLNNDNKKKSASDKAKVVAAIDDKSNSQFMQNLQVSLFQSKDSFFAPN